MGPLDQLKTDGITGLITGAREGVHTLPDQILDDYAEVEAIAAEHVDRWGRVNDDNAARNIDQLVGKIGAALAYGCRDQVIREHLQPALDVLLDTFRKDIAAAGNLAHQPGPTLDMLTAPDKTRAAYVRLHDTNPRYGRLRSSWRTLHRGVVADPLGATSPLAEIENIDHVVPDWRTAHPRAAWPWPANVFHIRLAWLLDHDAHMWLPTPDQHDHAWRRHCGALTAA